VTVSAGAPKSPKPVGFFKKGDELILVIPKEGEEASDAIKRVAEEHKFDPSQVKKGEPPPDNPGEHKPPADQPNGSEKPPNPAPQPTATAAGPPPEPEKTPEQPVAPKTTPPAQAPSMPAGAADAAKTSKWPTYAQQLLDSTRVK
jgi:hypothetical protein